MHSQGQAPAPFQHSRAHTWPAPEPSMMRQPSGPPPRPQSGGSKAKLFFFVAVGLSMVILMGLGVSKVLNAGKENHPEVVASAPPAPTTVREPNNRLVPVDPGAPTDPTQPSQPSSSSPPASASSSPSDTPSHPSSSPASSTPSSNPTSEQPAPQPTFAPIVVGWTRNVLAPADLATIGAGKWTITKDLAGGAANPLGGCSANPQVSLQQTQRTLRAGSGEPAAQVVSRVIEQDKNKDRAIAAMKLFRDTVAQCPTRALGSVNSSWSIQDSSDTPFGEVLVVKRQPVQPSTTDNGAVYIAVRYDYRIAMVDYLPGASGPDSAVVDQLHTLLKREVCANGTC